MLGFFGAALVWQFIYSIGSSVVSDELHYELAGTVSAWGTVAGACSGFAVGAVANTRAVAAFIAFAVLHVSAVLAGMFGGSSRWANGIYGYFGAHAASVIGCGGCAVLLVARKLIRNQPLTASR
ncbi:MAG TPA: hypothetical protein VL371_21470 [Gemmataceae bacterium]|nr:hypothetical protein [Gemmataceae bacterium]